MSAVISGCGRFRFRLERDVQAEGSIYAFFGINPSTADAEVDDQTVKKWKGFSLAWGGKKFIVGNVCAYRATNVCELSDVVLSPAQVSENLAHIRQIAADADVLVPCWGNRMKAPKHMRADFDIVLNMLLASGKPVRHLGLTKRGDPRHPLMLDYSTSLISWGTDQTSPTVDRH